MDLMTNRARSSMLGSREVAAALGVSQRQARKLMASQMPATRVGGTWKIARWNLAEWLEAQTNFVVRGGDLLEVTT